MACSLLQACIKIQTLIRMFLAMCHKEKLYIRYSYSHFILFHFILPIVLLVKKTNLFFLNSFSLYVFSKFRSFSPLMKIVPLFCFVFYSIYLQSWKKFFFIFSYHIPFTSFLILSPFNSYIFTLLNHHHHYVCTYQVSLHETSRQRCHTWSCFSRSQKENWKDLKSWTGRTYFGKYLQICFFIFIFIFIFILYLITAVLMKEFHFSFWSSAPILYVHCDNCILLLKSIFVIYHSFVSYHITSCHIILRLSNPLPHPHYTAPHTASPARRCAVLSVQLAKEKELCCSN